MCRIQKKTLILEETSGTTKGRITWRPYTNEVINSGRLLMDDSFAFFYNLPDPLILSLANFQKINGMKNTRSGKLACDRKRDLGEGVERKSYESSFRAVQKFLHWHGHKLLSPPFPCRLKYQRLECVNRKQTYEHIAFKSLELRTVWERMEL